MKQYNKHDSRQFTMKHDDGEFIFTLHDDIGDDVEYIKIILDAMLPGDKYITCPGTCGLTTITRIK